MWSKRTHDILFVIFVLLLIGVSLFAKFFVGMGVDFDKPISRTNQFDMDAWARGMQLRSILYSIPVFIYGILVIILAIQMHKRDFIPMSDTILIIIFSPLAIVWYPFVLRKHFKKVSSNIMAIQPSSSTQ